MAISRDIIELIALIAASSGISAAAVTTALWWPWNSVLGCLSGMTLLILELVAALISWAVVLAILEHAPPSIKEGD